MTCLFSMFALVGGLMLLAAGLVTLPALVLFAAIGLGLWILLAVLGLVFRLVGGVLLLALALPAMVVVGAVALAFGLVLVPLVLPLLLLGVLVWAVARIARSPRSLQPAPKPGG
ncbi:MAG TPA: hypothetical protein VFG55_07660 [Rhodanobacteraceae bacterium]|nr:hypothetical protein [Rhodanobacteraceae bacterium]